MRSHVMSTLIAIMLTHQVKAQQPGVSSCPVRMRPSGQCGDGEECPYQVSLPPLTVQLPKQFRQLEKMDRELKSLREEVNELRATCLECRPQADDAEAPTAGQQGATAGASVQDMKAKMSRMSVSLKNARRQIEVLQGRLEELNLINMKNVEAMVDNRVENITSVITQLSDRCSSPCAAQAQNMIVAPRDCSDYSMQEEKVNGVYRVMPYSRGSMFDVYCDLESYGGGWTVIQQRLNGSVNFNRTWEAYKKGFGSLLGEFWLGNDYIHELTRAKDMVLRIELEDFNGVREYAKYDQFYVANEYLRYRLSISGYSGTAGDAMHFSKHYDHDQKFFSTHDRDNDMYPSGSCGAYYGSGWWFDSCMSANLNGKYYKTKYKGVRNGIFWSTWHNVSTEFYPTNYRQAFKTVKMMIRPKNYAP